MQGGARDAPSLSTFFFMQFSEKVLPNNRLTHPPLGNPGSITEMEVYILLHVFILCPKAAIVCNN